MFGGGQTIAREGSVEEKEEWDIDTRLAGDRETLGLYLTGHPVDRERTQPEREAGNQALFHLAKLVDSNDHRGRGEAGQDS